MQPVTFFKALADPTRLKLMIEISNHDSICVCDLIEKLDQPQPTISRHLAHLRKAGLVSSERRGTWIWYGVDPELPAWCTDIISNLKYEDV